MRVLLTNDDGIGAVGLNELRRGLLEVPGVELSVVAPSSNRSATARSITTRSPLKVEEFAFADGTTGFATGGTPVDCVRFADLGLVGERPELIVSGINHGANLGDDITYSGTVAAALEGIVLGIPAIAVSQQSDRRELDFRLGRSFDFTHSVAFTCGLVRRQADDPMPEATLININCPAGTPDGVEVTRLGKRIYNDELKLVDTDEQTGHKHYEIYGFEPTFEDEQGTDLHAVARGRIAVSALHFDLTDPQGLDWLRDRPLDDLIPPGGEPEAPGASGRR
ncbi:MAG: 5'/3'-nucleotidase SurE [Solirubrobacterales bacterium]